MSDIRAALSAWQDAEDAFAEACAEAEAAGYDEPTNAAYQYRDDSAVDFASAAAPFIREILAVIDKTAVVGENVPTPTEL